MATGISPPPPFLETPGTPAIPWHRWFRLFQNFVLASGADEWPATRRRALLLHCLGPEGQRIFDALPAPPPPQPPLSTEATVSESTEKQTSAHTAAASPPDPYDVAVDTLAHYFTATVNVRVERHHFRERRQLSGESVAEFALALRELAAPCNFAATVDDNLCEQFVAGVTCPQLRERLLLEGDALTFDRAVEIAKLREQTRQEAEAFANPIRRITQRQRGRNPARHDSPRFRFNGSRPPSQHRRSSSRTRQNYKPKPETAAADPLHAVSRDNCDNCGATGCERSRCPARGRTCYGCGRRGHFQSVCRSSRRGQPRRPAPVRELLCDDDAESGHSILTICTNKRRGLYVDVDVSVINPKPLTRKVSFLIDTGSAVSIIGEGHFRNLFQDKVQLRTPSITLFDFSRQKIPVLGLFEATLSYKARTAVVPLYVTRSGTSLLGLDAVQALNFQISGKELRCLHTVVQQTSASATSTLPATSSDAQGRIPPQGAIVEQPQSEPKFGMPALLWARFSHLFTPGLGLVRGFQHKVKMKQAVSPVAQKLRRLPFSVRQPVSDQLQTLLSADIIERIDASEWVSPIVAVQKEDGSIRLCVDLREPNKAIVVDNFPLPHTEELLHALNGARHFSKLDLASAYHQVLLHPDSRDLTAFVTHEGLFRFKRVCFGLASAPAAFQQLMTRILQGCHGVLCYIDDIIVFGKTEKEHAKNLEEVLHRIAKAGLKLNEKCVFNATELSFLGHRVSAEGIAPLQAKVDAIVHAPTPAEPGTLRSFLGLVEYYAKFIPRLAEEVEPMRRLLRKDIPFEWDTAAQASFERVKTLLASHKVLHMFDPALPVTVATDASAYGLGAVLQQVDGQKTLTIAFASRTLTNAERKYSASEREALACVWACEKWHVYLWGRPFTLQTDHQALVALLSNKGTGRRPFRIARWAERLLRYNYTVEYRKGSENKVADALSRLPAEGKPECTPQPKDDSTEVVFLVEPLCIAKDQFEQSTSDDATLAKVKEYVTSSWPPHKLVPSHLLPYFMLRNELSVVNNLLLRGERLVVPQSLAHQVISTAHEAHPGIVRTKARLRERFWWPGMDRQTEVAIQNCSVCQKADKSAKTAPAPLQPVPFPERPWQKVAIDIVGPLERAPQDCRFAITLVDYFSKWPEVQFSNEVSTRTITNFLLSIFSREGYPDEIVTDNGPQFSSREFSQFLDERGIRLTHSSVYYPQANGLVERFNRVFKDFVQVAALEHGPLRQAALEYLGVYRCTPHATTGVAPALLLHGRLPRTRLDIIGHPSPSFFTDPAKELGQLRKRVAQKQKYSKMYTDFRRAAKKPNIAVGDMVRVKKPAVSFKGDLSFSRSRKVVEQRGPASFCLDDGRTWNSSKLSKVPAQAAQPHPVIQTPDVHAHPAQPSSPSPVPCDSGQSAVPLGTPLSAVPSVLCSPCVASQETQQAVSSPPSPQLPSRRELPARTRRPPRRFMDYV